MAKEEIKALWNSIEADALDVEAQLNTQLQVALSDTGYTVPPEFVRAIHDKLALINERIITVQKRDVAFMSLINHDLKEDCVDAKVMWQAVPSQVRRGGRPEREIIIDSIKETRAAVWMTVRGVQALNAWFDVDRVHGEPTDLSIFFTELLPKLERTFDVHGDRTLTCSGENGLHANMHQGTVASLLVNMVRNSFGRGHATQFDLRVARAGRSKVTIEACDNGTGIDVEPITRIYQKGYSLHDSSGVGLAEAPLRMGLMKGTIVCEPHGGIQGAFPKAGAKFTLTLPRV